MFHCRLVPMLELSRARASTCQTRALCKIDVHLISTLVNKSLYYYYYYYSRQHDVSLMRVSILHLRFEKEICQLDQILDSFPFSSWPKFPFDWKLRGEICLENWSNGSNSRIFSFLYMTKFHFGLNLVKWIKFKMYSLPFFSKWQIFPSIGK